MVISHQQHPSTICDILQLSFDYATSTANMILLYMKNPVLCWWVSFPFPVRTVYRTADLAPPMSHTELILILVQLFSFSPAFQVPRCVSIFCCINHSQDPVQFSNSCNSAYLYGERLLHLTQSPCWKTTTICWPSITGHSVYLQLPTMSVSHIVQQPRHGDWPAEHWLYCAVVFICYIVLLFLFVMLCCCFSLLYCAAVSICYIVLLFLFVILCCCFYLL